MSYCYCTGHLLVAPVAYRPVARLRNGHSVLATHEGHRENRLTHQRHFLLLFENGLVVWSNQRRDTASFSLSLFFVICTKPSSRRSRIKSGVQRIACASQPSAPEVTPGLQCDHSLSCHDTPYDEAVCIPRSILSIHCRRAWTALPASSAGGRQPTNKRGRLQLTTLAAGCFECCDATINLM